MSEATGSHSDEPPNGDAIKVDVRQITDAPPPQPGWVARILEAVASKGLPLLATAGGLLGFVAFVGGAATWARFYAVKLPGAQAVDAVPRTDLIATGAAALTVFAVAGALAVLITYLISTQGLPTQRMLRGLLVIALGESILAVALELHTVGWDKKVAVVLVLLAVTALTLWVIHRGIIKGHKDGGDTKGAQKQRPTEGCEKSEPPPPDPLHWWVYVTCAVLGAVAGLAAWCLMDKWWLAIAIPLSGALGFIAYRVAAATGRRFDWFGVAVFFSVAVFGGVVAVLRALEEPKVQPAAVIRTADGQQEGLQAVFVADDDKRVWLGSVAVGCGGDDVTDDGGRLFSIPRKDVELLAVGPIQPLPAASRRAPQMLQDLMAVRLAKAKLATTAAAKAKPKAKSRAPRATTTKRKKAARKRVKQPRPLSVGPAVRRDPVIEKVEPRPAPPGKTITISGSGFGDNTGRVTVGGAGAVVKTWSKEKITAKVPAAARSGYVRVACPTPVDPALLPVTRPPRVKAKVQPVKRGRQVYLLDAKGSKDPDGGKIIDYSWRIGGDEIVNGKRRRKTLERGHRTVELVVTDDEGDTATAKRRVSVRGR